MSEIDAPTITVERSVLSIRKSYCPPMRRVSLQSLDGTWGVKYRKVYELDAEENHIPDGKGGWENHKEDANDRNNKGNAEKWRTARAAHLNKTLQSKGVAARIQRRSYKRRSINQMPGIYRDVTVMRVEKRGVRRIKGDFNRAIVVDNERLKKSKPELSGLIIGVGS